MLGIPEWALGVGLIVVIISVAQIVGRAVGLEGSHRGRKVRFIDPTDNVQALADVQARLLELDQLKQRVIPTDTMSR